MEDFRKCGMVSWPSLGTSASRPSPFWMILTVSVSSTTLSSKGAHFSQAAEGHDS
jgi:hypothetical protein